MLSRTDLLHGEQRTADGYSNASHYAWGGSGDGTRSRDEMRALDVLELEVTLKREIRNMTLYAGVARVDGEQAACAEILCAEVDRA